MINNSRIKILRSLERLTDLAPEMRFGQLIANLSYLAIGPTNEAIWDMEDDQLLEAIHKQTEALLRRQPSLEPVDSSANSNAIGDREPGQVS